MNGLQNVIIFGMVRLVSCLAWTPYNVNPNVTSSDETQWRNRGWCVQNPPKLDKLEYKGEEYDFKLAQGIWQSPRPVARAIKYFLEEQLNIKVELLAGSSSEGILKEIANCSNFVDCQQGANDIESYPPPAWAAAEVWTSGANEAFLARSFTDVLGGVGYRTYPGMYMYRHTFDTATANNFSIRWYETLRYPESLQYFTKLSVLDTKLRNITGCSMPDGSSACAPRCIAGDSFHDTFFGDFRNDCDARGWWLAPACRSDPEKCIPVVLWVPFWNANEMAQAAVQSNLPLAITWLWFVGAGRRAIPELSSDSQMNFLFYWWGTDRTFGQQMSGSNSPKMVNFAQEQKPKLIEIDQVQLPEVVVWKHLKRVDEVVYDAWKKIKIPQETIDTMLADVANGKSPEDIACAWMRSAGGADVWSAWLPDLSDCKQGFYFNSASGSARDKCVVCKPGKFTNERGQTECVSCPAGKYQSEAGQKRCLECHAGSYATGGAQSCTQCARGTYAVAIASSACASCETHLKGSNTIDSGSISPHDCVCAAGNYMPANSLACKACPAGMTCPIGSEETGFTNGTVPVPILDSGFWSSKQEPLMVYACKPKEDCPGGAPETCKGGKLGIACGLCDDTRPIDDDGCQECTGSKVFGAVLGLLVLITLPIILYPGVNAPHQWKLAPREALLITCEVIFELLQVCAAITLMDVDWPGIALNLVDIFAVFRLEIVDIIPLPCLFPLTKDVPIYIAGCLVIPGMVLTTILLHPLCSRVLPRVFRSFPQWDLAGTFNLCGKIVNVLFISQVMMSMVPLQCYSHPNGENSSVREFPSTVCWSGDHHVMLIFGTISLLTCIACFVYLLWELHRAPKRLAKPDHTSYMKRITFMVEDFKLNRYWWNILCKVQELFLGTVILFDANNTRIQLAIFMIIFVCSILLWTRHWPYKLPLVNLMSSVTFSILVMVLLLGTNKLPISNEEEDSFSSSVLTFFLFGAFAMIIGTLSLVIVNFIKAGKHGEVFPFIHLQRIPPVKELVEYWEDVSQLSKEDMHTMVESWEHHERMFLLRVLVQLHVPGVGNSRTNAFRSSTHSYGEVQAAAKRLSDQISRSDELKRPSLLTQKVAIADDEIQHVEIPRGLEEFIKQNDLHDMNGQSMLPWLPPKDVSITDITDVPLDATLESTLDLTLDSNENESNCSETEI